MPFYKELNPGVPVGRRTIEKLLTLRQALDGAIPQRTLEKTLLLATWNIREFDSGKYGLRTPESFYYIAEIIARFDLVAVQEVRENLRALDQLRRILGSNWDCFFTDITEGTQGNGERMAFLYDNRKISPSGLASQLVIPPMEIRTKKGPVVFEPAKQLVRTPFIMGFKSGWTKFTLTTVHIYYGDSTKDNPLRVEEINKVAQFLRKKNDDPSESTKNLILLGDFNIFSPEDVTMKAIENAGFKVPEELQDLPSNIARDKFYDQIAFLVREDRFGTTGKAGVFDFFDLVFREDEELMYAPEMGPGYVTNNKGEPRTDKEKSRYYRDWRTHQMSDHLPMWVELRIDFSDEYLQRLLEPEEG